MRFSVTSGQKVKLRLGIDLGGTKIEIAIVNAEGIPVWRQRLPSVMQKTDILEHAYQQTLEIIAELLRQAGEVEPSVAALPVGIGTPGAECADGTMKNCNSVWLNGRHLRRDLELHLQRPVHLANDANCFALAEAHMGAARNAQSVFGVILGTGVGGGLVFNGQLHQGINHIAGEWGHNRLPAMWPEDERPAHEIAEPAEKRACYCGRYNCVETFLSGPGLGHSYFLASGERCSVQQVMQKLAAGNTAARQVWQQYLQQLARSLAEVINIVDPEVIVLGGGLSNIPALYGELPRYWRPYIFSNEIGGRLVRAELGDSAGVFGAAWLWSS
jgi:predicted NBD/HSP70 family sugar kinase